ncbi:redoxin domain-containing protein [bacterium AH-315-E10]|nr:redoxin domain-containing protein [bacterium AH-315-E10]
MKLLIIIVLISSITYGQGGDFAARMKRMVERFDTNKDGILTKEEFKGRDDRFKRMDSNGDGQVDAKEIEMMSQRRSQRRGQGSGMSEKLTKKFGEDKSPAVGETTRDFTLKILDEDESITLSTLYADKPVVLTLGSYTCPPYRKALEGIEKLYKEYGEDCTFIFVYISEAHASDGWVSRANTSQKINVKQHTSYEERSDAAQTCQGALKISMPILVDTLDNATEKLFGAAPNRTFLIDKGGKVLYKGPRGPKGTQAEAVKKAIKKLLGKTK